MSLKRSVVDQSFYTSPSFNLFFGKKINTKFKGIDQSFDRPYLFRHKSFHQTNGTIGLDLEDLN
jgi:hypothetical protein